MLERCRGCDEQEEEEEEWEGGEEEKRYASLGVLSVGVKADCSRDQEAEQIRVISCTSNLVQIFSVVMKYFYNSVILPDKI